MTKGKIYTKKGDGGTTSTLRGKMDKGDQLAEALGTIDELNSWLGICTEEITTTESLTKDRTESFVHREQVGRRMLAGELRRMQSNLLTIGSGLAGSGKKITSYETVRLEKLIDRMTQELPKLNKFLLPDGKGGAAYLQVARTVARRAERTVVATGAGDKQTLKYLNRLSDTLFVLGRWVNKTAGGNEQRWG